MENQKADVSLKEIYEINSIDPKYLNYLKEKFRHDEFRDKQWEIISSVMIDKRDTCIIMASGYGKSLCYQFPSVFLNTITIIVSPLIALMQNQVSLLSELNIKSCYLGSAQENNQLVLKEISEDKYNLVYITPEFLNKLGTEFLTDLGSKLSLIAIDEAHCISKWGYNLRSYYKNLSFIKERCPDVPVLAVTSTANNNVLEDIWTELNLKNPLIIRTSIDNPNLELNVEKISNNFKTYDFCKEYICPILNEHFSSPQAGSVIIFCLTKDETDSVCRALQLQTEFNCKGYHSKTLIDERKKILKEFMIDELKIVISTIAFGIGIHKPNVRVIINYGAPFNIESYYQEIGRAGRDGLPSKCYMFYSDGDWKIHNSLMELAGDRDEMGKRSEAIKTYCELKSCRRKFILEYFDDKNLIESKNDEYCCDNCKPISSTSQEQFRVLLKLKIFPRHFKKPKKF